jgi:PIN domain nuclease of toxin-antitoxin system
VAHGDLRSDQSGACLGGDGSGIAIKSSFGKLDAPADLLDALRTSNLDTLPLQAGHAAALRDLPWHHRDPFDPLLIAQATVEDLAVASLDRSLAAYDIRPLPA